MLTTIVSQQCLDRVLKKHPAILQNQKRYSNMRVCRCGTTLSRTYRASGRAMQTQCTPCYFEMGWVVRQEVGWRYILTGVREGACRYGECVHERPEGGHRTIALTTERSFLDLARWSLADSAWTKREISELYRCATLFNHFVQSKLAASNCRSRSRCTCTRDHRTHRTHPIARK